MYFRGEKCPTLNAKGVPAVSTDEPEYLKALRRTQEAKKNPAKNPAPAKAAAAEKPAVQSPAEREAVRWGREVGGKDINILPFKAGSKCAILLHPITPFGAPRVTMEWVADREALAARYHQAQGAGENVLGSYELTTGRPLTAETVDGKLVLTAGQPRQIAKAESPERMVRKAAAEAALLAKTRKAEPGFGSGGFGGGGRSGGGGGRPGGQGGGGRPGAPGRPGAGPGGRGGSGPAGRGKGGGAGGARGGR